MAERTVALEQAKAAVEFSALTVKHGLSLRAVTSSVSIVTDSVLLGRVLQNFLSNAIRYTPAGQILLVRRRRKDTLRIEVWDTGIGIPENRQREIFEEFRRLTPEGISAEKGLGLGLAIVERIARLLDLLVTVKSSPGHGSMFAIDVPRARFPRETPVVAPLFAAVPASGCRFLILCIENDEAILDGMMALLEQWGHSAACARDYETALAVLGARVPYVILADCHLENEINGLDVLARLRQHWEDRVPTLLITADRTGKVRNLGHAAGADILYKPLKPAALRSYLNGVGGPGAPPAGARRCDR